MERTTRMCVGMVAGLVILGDYLLRGVEPGLGAALYVTILTAALLGARVRRRVDGPTRRLVLALVGLAGSLALDPGPLAVLLVLVGLTTLGLWARGGSDTELTVWAGRVAGSACQGWTRIFRDIPLLRRQCRDIPLQDMGRGAGDWVIPVTFSLVFVILFAVANPILADWGSRLFSYITDHLLNFGDTFSIGRMFFWTFLGTILWTWSRHRTGGWFAGCVDDRLSFRDDVARPATIIRCLVLFNAVFAVQTLFDLVVLGTGGGLPAGMSYAEYAHRGAYPLILTALLAGLFVLITFSAGQKAAEDGRARRLVYAWIGQNLLLLVSTLYRLSLYVDVYGLTRWRLATFVWMGLVGLGFAFIAARVIACRTNGWLIRRNAVACAAVLYTSCFVDWDGIIARHNVTHSSWVGGEGPAVDIEYLESLGLASRPALAELMTLMVNRGVQDARPHYVLEAIQRLDIRADGLISDWRSWTFRAWRT